MRRFTTLKFLFLLPLFMAGVFYAQSVNTSVKKEAKFTKKSQEELIKSHGFDRCSTIEYENYLKAKFPERMTTEQFESWLAPLIDNVKVNKSQNRNTITIPVVVHVIHSGQNVGVAPNIVDEQVMSQITVMNNDYRRLAGTPGFNNNTVGADVEIQFVLAKVDPKGNPTNGIDRVNLCQNSWSRADIETFVKPETIWDPTKYLNMWSLKFSDASLLGYAQFPSNSNLPGLDVLGGEAYSDGVVANFATFGSSDYNVNNTFMLSAPYDKGRTMTHEVGHFLGLRHIWGDDSCGDDYCADTPTAHTANYDCDVTIASCTDLTVFEMVQNYMDYTNDTCMNIFTVNQKDRITAVMNNSPRRTELKTSIVGQSIPLFPNDAEVKLERECTTVTCATTAAQNVKVSLYNRGTSPLTSAIIVYSVNGNAKTYNWSGNLAQDKYQIVTLPMDADVLGGPMNINVTSVNGTTDQRASNSNITVNYLGAAVRVDKNVIFNLQLDRYGSETTWELKNNAGVVVQNGGPYQDSETLPALKTFNWTLNSDECYTLTVKDEYGDGFYPYGGYYNIKSQSGATLLSGSHFASTQSRALKVKALETNDIVKSNFSIYPNPVSDILNIAQVSDKTTFEIHNTVGQLVKSGIINNNQIGVADLGKGTYIISIKDHTISERVKFIKK